MQMLYNILIYLPFYVSIAAAAIFMVMRRKKYSTTNIAIVCMFASVYFFCDAAFVGGTDSYATIVTLEVMAKYSVLFLLPSIVVYYKTEADSIEPHPTAYFSYAPALTVGTTSLVIYLKTGMNKLADFLHSVDMNGGMLPPNSETLLKVYWGINEYITGTIVIVEIVAVFIHLAILYLRRRKREGRDYRLFFMMLSYFLALGFAATRVVLGREYLTDHRAISGFMSLFMAIGMTGAAYFHTEMKKSVGETAPEEPGQPKEKEDIQEPAPIVQTEGEITPQMAALKEQTGKISEFFKKEKPYLDPDLTLEQCADMMGTNRTYISLSLNSYYGKSFREYVNEYRISYAKKYILEHRNSKLEEVAEVSGFKSGAQFSRKFKEIEGVTPLVWIRNQI